MTRESPYLPQVNTSRVFSEGSARARRETSCREECPDVFTVLFQMWFINYKFSVGSRIIMRKHRTVNRDRFDGPHVSFLTRPDQLRWRIPSKVKKKKKHSMLYRSSLSWFIALVSVYFLYKIVYFSRFSVSSRTEPSELGTKHVWFIGKKHGFALGKHVKYTYSLVQ